MRTPILPWLVVAAFSLGAAPPGKAGSEPLATRIQRASEYARSGNEMEAQKELALALKEAPKNASALFVQTCLFLEQGALPKAEQSLKRLRAVAAREPEVAILASLVEQRRRQPKLDWRDAFLDAWVQAGRPHFAESRLLRRPPSSSRDGKPELEAAWEHTESSEVRLILALSGGMFKGPDLEWLATHLDDVKDPVLLRAAFEHFMTAAPRHPEALAKARTTLKPRLQQLAAEAPQEMQLRLLLLLENTDLRAPLTREELTELERIASLPDFRAAATLPMYTEAVRLLTLAKVPLPQSSGFSSIMGLLALTGPHRLTQRALFSDTLPPPDRQRLGRALVAIGKRLSEESMLVEYRVGLRMVMQGADLLEDAKLQTELATVQGEALKLSLVMPPQRMELWPLPSLQRAWTTASLENEREHLRAFLTP
ncbi:tetratricopeptide repeat protein [Corallococcus terminator]